MSQVIELLDEKGIYYKLSGQDVLIRCLNPNHDDSNPSMRIDKVLGVFNCFSCGYKGSLFKHYNVDYSETAIRREKLSRMISSLRSAGIGLEVPKDATRYVGTYRNLKQETYDSFGAFRHSDSHFLGRINFAITNAS